MTDSILYMRDTGKLVWTDSGTTYSQVNSGTWQQLYAFTISGDFTADITSNDANRTNGTYSNLLSFAPNDVTQLQAPRFIIRGVVPSSQTTMLRNIINFQRAKGVKEIKGGLGLLTSLPEASNGTIAVLVKNISFSEVYNDDTTNIGVTINVEQQL